MKDEASELKSSSASSSLCRVASREAGSGPEPVTCLISSITGGFRRKDISGREEAGDSFA
jgi:hypothetical protein